MAYYRLYHMRGTTEHVELFDEFEAPNDDFGHRPCRKDARSESHGIVVEPSESETLGRSWRTKLEEKRRSGSV